MKKRKKNVEENVLKGLVLDEKGNWVTIAEKVERERDFLQHLEAGEVLFDGKWVQIGDLKKNEVTIQAEPIDENRRFTELDETKDISSQISSLSASQPDKPLMMSAEPEIAVVTSETAEAKTAKEEKDDFFRFHPEIEAEQETKYIEKSDIKKAAPPIVKAPELEEKDNDELFQETMAFDMKAILGTTREHALNLNADTFDNVGEQFEIEEKKRQVLIFSISITAALFAVVGAVILAFIL